MNKFFTLILITFFVAGVTHGQSVMELKEKQQAVLDAQTEAQAKVDELQGEIDALQREIEITSGWTKGFAGVIGLNLNNSSNWAKNANPNGSSTGLAINGTGFITKEGEKAFWRNTGILNLGWQKVDPDTNVEGDGTGFDRNTDILNISSLAGYKLSDNFALSGLGELNSSIGSFLDPGTFDIGVGATYTGIPNLVLVVHPANLHVAFPESATGLGTKSFFGAKLRADYLNEFSNGITWATNFTSFHPYSGSFLASDGTEISAFEWTWLNTLSFPVWNGVGIGVSFGLRNAAFEFDGTQNFYSLGLSYNL